MYIELKNINKSFGDFQASKKVNFAIEKGKLVGLLGPSGSGKTTLLRCLNFLEHPDNGIIRVNGETLFDASVPATTQESVIRKKRLHFGLVFQNFNLFPQYTALENVMLAKTGWTIIRISFPADNASELLLQGHLPCNRTSSVLMSRLLHWIRN